jgi:tRNA-binding EMAP/Myf-like protein
MFLCGQALLKRRTIAVELLPSISTIGDAFTFTTSNLIGATVPAAASASNSDSQAVKATVTEKAPRPPRISTKVSRYSVAKPSRVSIQVRSTKIRRFHITSSKLASSSFSLNIHLNMAPSTTLDTPGERSASRGHDRPLVVGRTKPTEEPSKDTVQNLNASTEQNIQANTETAAPSEPPGTTPTPAQPQTQKKEKAPKQPKPSKAPATPTAPLSPALLDLRVGHILRCIAHPNADSLFVSTIAMGDEEGADHTQVDEETGKVVRTVCSGLNGLVPLAEMQDRKVVVVANLKPVNMRSIKSAAMVLAASPKAEEGADPHAADRVVELVQVPDGSEAGDKVYFEGWPYGVGRGPEKQLNPKKKQWEAIQPGFYTNEDLVVGFDAAAAEGVEGGTGDLVVEGKGKCFVKTLKGAVVR